jgi:hypothetical protein
MFACVDRLQDWHQHVTKDLRNYLVGKIVRAILVSPDPAAMYDPRIRDLIAYARRVEKEMFEEANDRVSTARDHPEIISALIYS